MKRKNLTPTYFIALLALCGCSTAPNADESRLFEQAEVAFASATDSEDYIRVAGTYQQLVEDGVRSPSVFFNQGNAFAKAERYGRAIACYRQAMRLDPTADSVRSNLQTAMRKTGAVQPAGDWLQQVFFWQDWTSYASKFYLATALLSLAACSIVLARRKPGAVASRTAVFLSGLAIIAISSAVYDWYRFERIVSGTVVESNVTPRTGNGENYEPAFNQPLPEGTAVTIAEERGDWLRIFVKGTGNGWIQRDTTVIY
ncbi:MAG: tetratricopeptide repeat protein [Planctomycetaceae bacterium]